MPRSAEARRVLLAVALVASVATHTCERYLFTSFDNDKVVQVAAALSVLQGRGVTVAQLGPAGPPETVRAPLSGYPPGYVFALAPFAAFTHDVFWSTFALDVLATTAFLVAWAVMLRIVAGPPAAAGLLVLWALLYSPIVAAEASDLLAVALYSAALATAATAMAQGRGSGVTGLLSGTLTGAACATRYAYWPLAAVVPVAAMVAHRDHGGRRLAATHSVVSAALIVATAGFMRSTTGEVTYLDRWYPPGQRGFFWSHLLSLHPFPAQALGLDRLYERLGVGRPAIAASIPVVLWAISTPVLSLVIVFLLAQARAVAARRLTPAAVFFHVSGLLTVGATLATICALTVRLPAGPQGFLVGAEARYFMPALMFIGAWVALAGGADRRVWPPASRAAAVALVAAVVVTIPFRLARMRQYFVKNVHTAWLSAERRHDADVLRSAILSIDDGRVPPLVVTDDPKWGRGVAVMSGAAVMPASAFPRCVTSPDRHVLVAVPRAGTGIEAHPALALVARATRATRVALVADGELYDVVAPVCREH